MGDAVKPRPQFDPSLLPRQGPERLDHRVLNRVLGVLGFAQETEAKPVELLLIALEDCRDRPPIATACAACQAIVGEKSKRHAVQQTVALTGRRQVLRAWGNSLSLYAPRRRSHQRRGPIGSKSSSIHLPSTPLSEINPKRAASTFNLPAMIAVRWGRRDYANAETRQTASSAEGSGRRVSNPRPRAWEARALPTELRPRQGLILGAGREVARASVPFP